MITAEAAGADRDSLRSPRIVITCATYEPGFRGAGPARSVKQIIETAPTTVEVLLVTRDRDLGDDTPYSGLSGAWLRSGQAEIFYLDVRSPHQWWRLIRQLRRRPISLLYLNSFWNPALSIAPFLLALLRVLPVRRVLVAPRGELSPGALGIKSKKKRVFLRLWTGVLRLVAPLWHASNEAEAAEIERTTGFPRSRILISSDQVSEPGRRSARLDATSPKFVYVGRISRKKNLKLIMTALRHVALPVILDVYGPVEDPEYWAECEDVAGNLPAHVSVVCRGELPPDAVVDTFSRYDVFLFPTLGENFGHVIAESLAGSCPVICSEHTPWTSVLDGSGAGEIVHDLTATGLAAVIDRWAAFTPANIAAAHVAARQTYTNWLAGQDRTNILALALAADGVDASP